MRITKIFFFWVEYRDMYVAIQYLHTGATVVGRLTNNGIRLKDTTKAAHTISWEALREIAIDFFSMKYRG